jgi:hypothetical protein
LHEFARIDTNYTNLHELHEFARIDTNYTNLHE